MMPFAMPNSMEDPGDDSSEDSDNDGDDDTCAQLGVPATNPPASRFTFQELLGMLAKEHDRVLAMVRAEISSNTTTTTPIQPFSAQPLQSGRYIPLGSSTGAVENKTLCVPDELVSSLSDRSRHSSKSSRGRVSFSVSAPIHIIEQPANEDQEEQMSVEPDSPRSAEPESPRRRISILKRSDTPFSTGGTSGCLAGIVPLSTHREDDDEAPRRKSLESASDDGHYRCNCSLSRIVKHLKDFEDARAVADRVIAIRGFLDHTNKSKAARWFATIWEIFILISACVPMVRMTEDERMENQTLDVLELIFDFCFLFELTARLATCPRIVAFLRSPYFIIDVLTMLPIVLRITVGGSVPAEEGAIRLSLLLLTPILRLMKLMRFFSFHFNLFGEVVNMTKGALVFLLLWLLVIVLVSSSLLYMVEPRTNLETYQRCIWLSLVTMTTVGYGDATPESTGGTIIIMTLMIVSFLFLAIPVGILGNAFTEVWADRDRLVVVWKFIEMLNEAGMSYGDIPSFYRRYDLGEDGAIGLREFKLMNEDMQTGLDEKSIAKLFQSVDKDDSGTIDQKEFIEAFFPSAFSALYGRIKLRRSQSASILES